MIIGAGVTGLETAEYLCHEGNTVVLADMLDKVVLMQIIQMLQMYVED